jgi:hypothetical protein
LLGPSLFLAAHLTDLCAAQDHPCVPTLFGCADTRAPLASGSFALADTSPWARYARSSANSFADLRADACNQFARNWRTSTSITQGASTGALKPCHYMTPPFPSSPRRRDQSTRDTENRGREKRARDRAWFAADY